MKNKYCTRCKKEKPIDQFFRDKYRTDGRKRTCKPCTAAYNKGMTLEEYKKYKEFKKEPVVKSSSTKNLVQVHYSKLNSKKKVRTYYSKAEKIKKGLEQDDYTNHMFSHFGFYDVAPDEEKQDKVVLQSAYAGKVNYYEDSKGIG